MHAVRQHVFGPPETLKYEQVPDPEPGPGQVHICVEASGVHFIDTSVRAGIDNGLFGLPDLPITPGREVAGTVDGVGPGVEDDWLGRRVVAHLGRANGGYAESAVAAVADLHALADDVDPAAAVAMIGTGRTTMAILEVAAPTSDDVIVVTGAAGGIGTLAVQEGVRLGATVVGVAGGPHKVARIREAAAIGVDHGHSDWAGEVVDALAGRHVTLALDGVGGDTGRRVLELLGPGGRLVLYGWASGSATRLDASDVVGRGITVSGAIGARLMRGPGGLRRLEEMALARLADGCLVPAVQQFALSDAAAAHAAIESRATIGKVVLTPARA